MKEVSSLQKKAIAVVSFTSDTPAAERQTVRDFVSQRHLPIMKFSDHRRFIFRLPCVSYSVQCVNMHHASKISLTQHWILVTPEKLCSSEFLRLLYGLYAKGRLNRLVVDEVMSYLFIIVFLLIYFFLQAHCISVTIKSIILSVRRLTSFM